LPNQGFFFLYFWIKCRIHEHIIRVIKNAITRIVMAMYNCFCAFASHSGSQQHHHQHHLSAFELRLFLISHQFSSLFISFVVNQFASINCSIILYYWVNNECIWIYFGFLKIIKNVMIIHTTLYLLVVEAYAIFFTLTVTL